MDRSRRFVGDQSLEAAEWDQQDLLLRRIGRCSHLGRDTTGREPRCREVDHVTAGLEAGDPDVAVGQIDEVFAIRVGSDGTAISGGAELDGCRHLCRGVVPTFHDLERERTLDRVRSCRSEGHVENGGRSGSDVDFAHLFVETQRLEHHHVSTGNDAVDEQ